jgi:hypothetical protein
VYDRDDHCWTSESDFIQAIASLALNPEARAVVIRSGASSTARAKAIELTNATHAYLITADSRELGRRVATRGRSDKIRTLAGIKTWFGDHDRDDHIEDFPGWGCLGESALPKRTKSRDW